MVSVGIPIEEATMTTSDFDYEDYNPSSLESCLAMIDHLSTSTIKQYGPVTSKAYISVFSIRAEHLINKQVSPEHRDDVLRRARTKGFLNWEERQHLRKAIIEPDGPLLATGSAGCTS